MSSVPPPGAHVVPPPTDTGATATHTDGTADPTQPLQPDKSLGDLFGELTSQFSSLVRDEVELAKVELKAEAKTAGKAGGMLAGAGVAGLLALVLLSFAAAWALAEVVPAGLAFAIVGIVYLAIAAVLGLIGKNKIQDINPKPEETIETIQEDIQWAKKQIN